MAMIYLGNSTYFDTDDLDDLDYSEFCKHRENLRKYYNKRNNESMILKATVLGIDIKEIISKAEDFVATNLLGEFDNWRNRFNIKGIKRVEQAVYIIANDIEE